MIYLIAIINNRRISNEIRNKKICGVIDEYEVSLKKRVTVRIDGTWHILHFLEDEFVELISVQDSIVKEPKSDSYKLYRNGCKMIFEPKASLADQLLFQTL